MFRDINGVKSLIISFVILILTEFSFAEESLVHRGSLHRILEKASHDLLDEQTVEGAWLTPAYLGAQYISLYSLALDWVGQSQKIQTHLDSQKLIEILRQTQLKDGSWYTVKDVNLDYGDINATIWNYWFLKSKKISTDDSLMVQARQWIRDRGGIEKSNAFTKILLALFAQRSWDIIPEIPKFLFSEKTPIFNYKLFGQWIGPHLMAFSYFRRVETSRDLGPNYRIDELWMEQPLSVKKLNTEFNFKKETRFMQDMMSWQQPRGSWGGYTTATMFTLMAMDDFRVRGQVSADFKLRDVALTETMNRAQSFIEKTYLHTDPEKKYSGITQDSRYWDTALINIGILDADQFSNRNTKQQLKILKSCEYITKSQVKNGGLPFGVDFEYAPDTDDTAIMIWMQSRCLSAKSSLDLEIETTKTSIKKAMQWLYFMQNDDGGWGAFSKNNTGLSVIEEKIKVLKDSTDFYDESSPDITGHILEALGTTSNINTMTVWRAKKYLYKEQKKEGYWEARWGVNAIYGTSAALMGLLKTGESRQNPKIAKALNWLMWKQNEDGGFGESTLSYSDPKNWAGIGMSTATQTSWALLALVEAGLSKSQSAEKAVRFLMDHFVKHEKWIDVSTVGTGHPGIVYMDYPSYPKAFPMMALGQYARAKGWL